jgi:hypothetical protein
MGRRPILKTSSSEPDIGQYDWYDSGECENEITCVRCSDAVSQMFRTSGMGTARDSRRVRPTNGDQSCCPDVATMRDDAGKRKSKVAKRKKRLSSDLFPNSTVQTGTLLINAGKFG